MSLFQGILKKLNNEAELNRNMSEEYIQSNENVIHRQELAQKENGVCSNEDEVIEAIEDIGEINEKKKQEKSIQLEQKEMQQLQKRFEILIQESSDIFEIIAPDGTILYVNEAVEKVLGSKPEERIGKKVYDYYEGEELRKLTDLVQSVLNNPHNKVQGEITYKAKTGKEIILELEMESLLSEPSIQGIVINVRDITQRVELRKKMQYIATHDELTGLPNRFCFKQQLETLCQHGRDSTCFALMILDVDGFKYVNDALGYDVGDQLAIEVAGRLKYKLDEKFSVFRYEGVQFAIIVPGLFTLNQYENIARDITNMFSKPFKVDKYELNLTVNLGISIYPKDATDASSLMKYANVASHQAKKDGKNRYRFYSSDINIQSYRYFQLRNDLRKAIGTDQLKVYYQPQVNLKTNEILAAEALLRWEHPHWGLISSDELFSLAEETGCITELGNWMLREVCKNYNEWQENGLPCIKVSVNFSSIRFFESNFVESIKNTIKEFDLDPAFLIMEIKESVLNYGKVIKDIEELKTNGIQIALDNFGSFSSLAYLTSFNIGYMKLDSALIKEIPLDIASNVITKNLINMARELNIKVLAEGIENLEQLSYLRRLNCNAGQGYLYSEPVPIKEFQELLAKKIYKPVFISKAGLGAKEERRKYFRIQFNQLLEADMTFLKINGKKIDVGYTKVLIEDIGAGGLCFYFNVKLPVERENILQFKTQLLDVEIKVYGYIVWREEINDNLYKYGIEYTFDENDRTELIKLLNQVQIKMKNNILFAEGSFTSATPAFYFKSRADRT